jgi:hypothetical protein
MNFGTLSDGAPCFRGHGVGSRPFWSDTVAAGGITFDTTYGIRRAFDTLVLRCRRFIFRWNRGTRGSGYRKYAAG